MRVNAFCICDAQRLDLGRDFAMPQPMSSPDLIMPKRRRLRLSPEERRAQLLDVAIDVFAEMGIERAGHADIAKRAKVSTATVFNYFPSRPDLVASVLATIEAMVEGMFAGLPAPSDDPQERFLQLAVAYQGLIIEEPACAKTFLKWGVSFDPDIRPDYLAFQARLLDRLAAYFPEEDDPQTQARIILGAANMLAIMAFDGTPPEQLVLYAQRVAKTLTPDGSA